MLGLAIGIAAGAAQPTTNLIDPNAWQLSTNGGSGTATNNDGVLTIAGDGTHVAEADQPFTLTAGATYQITGTVATNAAQLRVGTVKGGITIASQVESLGNFSLDFTAEATTWIGFAKTSIGNAVISQITLRLA